MKDDKIPIHIEALKVLEELRATLACFGDGVIVTNMTGHITLMNPVAESLTGWFEVEASGKHLDEIFHIMNEKSHVRIENPVMNIQRDGKTVIITNDTLLITREKTLPITGYAAPIFNKQNAIVGMGLFFRDRPPGQTIQQDLRESEELHRIIIENILDPIFITDSSGKFTFVSPNISHIFGHPLKEIQTLGNISAWVNKGQSLFDLDELNRLGELSNIEAVITDKNGQKKDYLITVKRVTIKDGSILYVCRDITERKQAEEEHKAYIRFLENLELVDQAIKKEKDLEQMLRNILETVFSIFNCDRTWLFYPCDPDSPSFRVPMEIARPEYPGAKILNVDVPMHPEIAQNLREALETNDPVIYTAGTKRPVNKLSAEQFGVQSQMFTAIYPKLGKPWAFGIHQCSFPRIWTKEEKKLFNEIARRISDGLSSVLFLRELQENEKRFRATFEQAAVGIAHVAPEGQWLRVNQKLCDIVGYSRAELLQKKFQDITHPDDLNTDLEYIRKILAGEIQTYNMEKRYLHKDGSIVWIDLTVSLVRHSSGEAGYFISVVEDITRRKQAEKEKEKLQQQLLHAQKLESVGRLAGGVAHDFNNMLAAILGHVELAMMRCAASDPIYTNLQVIEDSAERSANLTRQLLAFARKQTVAPKVLDLNITVTNILKMLRRLIGEDVDLAWIPGNDLWLVKIDPSQVDQLLANLCVNARDAISGIGKVTIETGNIVFDETYCAAHPNFTCGEYVVLAVSDDGCGMSKETQARLFEPFFTTKEMGKGTGLGLATVYGIVKQNEGFINFYSEPDKGTIFKIYLPRVKGETRLATSQPTKDIPKGKGETILVVEDEPVILEMSRAMLEQLGYTVLSAGTPAEALSQASAYINDIQLLITDVIMPEMNGRELTELINNMKPGLKSLFVSGYTANVIAHHGVLDEGVYFLQKPFTITDLAIKVHQALEQN